MIAIDKPFKFSVGLEDVRRDFEINFMRRFQVIAKVLCECEAPAAVFKSALFFHTA